MRNIGSFFPAIGGADAAMRVDLQACDGFCGGPNFRERPYSADERREQL
jgi:hypothetical protein